MTYHFWPGYQGYRRLAFYYQFSYFTLTCASLVMTRSFISIKMKVQLGGKVSIQDLQCSVCSAVKRSNVQLTGKPRDIIISKNNYPEKLNNDEYQEESLVVMVFNSRGVTDVGNNVQIHTRSLLDGGRTLTAWLLPEAQESPNRAHARNTLPGNKCSVCFSTSAGIPYIHETLPQNKKLKYRHHQRTYLRVDFTNFMLETHK